MRINMIGFMERISVVWSAMIFSFLLIIVVHFCAYNLNTEKFADFYVKSMRDSLFTSFLTLSGFLYSLKTFIVIKMKENVYDTESYEETVKSQRKINPNYSRYGALRRLSDLLYYTVLFAIITSLMQFTIGLYEHWVAAIVCCYVALTSMFLFLFSLLVTKENMNYWFGFLEEEDEAKRKQEKDGPGDKL